MSCIQCLIYFYETLPLSWDDPLSSDDSLSWDESLPDCPFTRPFPMARAFSSKKEIFEKLLACDCLPLQRSGKKINVGKRF